MPKVRKGPKGGNKAPIFLVDPANRLFTAENGQLRHSVSCFSFYHFMPIDDPEAAARGLETALSAMGPLETFAGTLYLAKEGMNGQFSVATDRSDEFEDMLQQSALNILGTTAPLDLNPGATLPAGIEAPFKRFRVVSRPQILTDGLSEHIGGGDNVNWDWCDAGVELEAMDWHAELSATEGQSHVLLDCRNAYETDLGAFKGATPLGTAQFSESWDAIDRAVAQLPSKDEPVFAYCTGGIRCVKVGAYLKQRHGLSNVRRLRHGIIGYERWVETECAGEKASKDAAAKAGTAETGNLFKGTNFIFDQRPKKNGVAGPLPLQEG